MFKRLLTTSVASLTMLAGALAVPEASQASNYGNQTVEIVQVDGRPCVFFYLTNVSQADPVKPGDPWFAIPKSAANYQEMLSEILTAKLTGKAIYVATDGSLSCSYATATMIGLDQ